MYHSFVGIQSPSELLHFVVIDAGHHALRTSFGTATAVCVIVIHVIAVAGSCLLAELGINKGDELWF